MKNYLNLAPKCVSFRFAISDSTLFPALFELDAGLASSRYRADVANYHRTPHFVIGAIMFVSLPILILFGPKRIHIFFLRCTVYFMCAVH